MYTVEVSEGQVLFNSHLEISPYRVVLTAPYEIVTTQLQRVSSMSGMDGSSYFYPVESNIVADDLVFPELVQLAGQGGIFRFN